MADLNYFLNRQGPQGIQGPKGDKGDKGDSITIYDGTVTPLIYTLIFDKGNGNTFETQNIRYPLEDRLGTYIRWDGTTQYLGTPDYADLTGVIGEVRLATTVNVGNNTVLNTDAVSYELFAANNSTINEQLALKADKATTYTKTEVDNLVTPKADKTYVDTQLATKANAVDVYTKTQTDTLLAGKANTVHTHTLSQITDAGTFAAKNSLDYTSAELTNKPTLGSLAAKNTVDYQTEVTNKPTIPTVGNGTITINQGGVLKGTFNVNQSNNSTIELDAGGGGGTSFTAGTALELTNQDVLNVKIDNSTIITDSSGALKCNVTPGSTYTFTAPLVNTSGTISLDIDTDTMNITDGKLGANLEDITDALEAILGGDASIFSDYYTKTQCDGRFAPLSHTHLISQITDFPTLATVATSGDYNDLTNKPTIPSTTNMVTTDTVQDLSNSKYFVDDNLIHFGISKSSSTPYTYHTVLSKTGFKTEYYQNSSNYGVIQFSTYFNNPAFTVLKNGIPTTTITDNYGNYWFNTGALDGTTITYDSNTGKVSANVGSSGIETDTPIAPLEYKASEKAGSYTTTDVTQDSSNEHKYTPTSTNGEIKISYEQPVSYTYLKTGELKFKTNSETPGNGTIITCNPYKTFLPILIFDAGNIICRLPNANQTSSNSYYDMNLGTTALNTEYTFSVEFISGVWNVNFNGNTYTYDTQANAITFDTSYSSNMYNSIKFGGSPSKIAWVDVSDYVLKINSMTIYADTDSKLLLNYDNDVLAINTNNKLTISSNKQHLMKAYLDEGELLTDTEGLADLAALYANSTAKTEVVKCDDCSITGNPNIDDKGVASGFNSTNNLKTIQCKDLTGKSWKIKARFWAGVTGDANIFNPSGGWNAQGGVSINTNNFYFAAKCGNTTESTAEGGKILFNRATYGITNAWYITELSFNYTTGTYTLSLYSDNGVLIVSDTYTPETTEKQLYSIATESTNYIRIGYSSDLSNSTSIDLSLFKIYVNDSPVFQPYLKIPYYKTATGSKIVDYTYRDEINYLYNKTHIAPYYTYQAGVDYTLPRGDIYGYPTQVIKSYAPSTTYISLTLGASGTIYTAPADGWVTFNKSAGTPFAVITLSTDLLAAECIGYNATDGLTVYIPVRKGENFTVAYTATGQLNYFNFIYAMNSESESN